MRRHTAVILCVFVACAGILFAQQGNFPAGQVAGSNGQLQYNNNGALAGATLATYNGASGNTLTVTGNSNGNAAISAQPFNGSSRTLNVGATCFFDNNGNFNAGSTCSIINATTISATGQVSSTLATGTAPLSVASTTTVPTLTVSNHPKVQFCGTTSTCSATALTTAQIVVGSAPLVSASPSTVTITGISPAFTSATSYDCNVTDETTPANNLLKVVNVSGSSFTITGPNLITDVISYVCAGN